MDNTFGFSTPDFKFDYTLSKHPIPENFKMHTHTNYELYFFMNGKGNFYAEGNKYPLRSGDVMIFTSSEAHYIDISPTMPYERCAIHFTKDFIKRLDQDTVLLDAFENRQLGNFNQFRRQDFAGDFYLSLWNNMLKPTNNQQIQVITNFFSVLNEIAIAFNNVTLHKQSENETSINNIIKFIMDNIEKPLSLDVICEKFFMSKAQLCRTFKKTTGSSVWNYITTKRLLKAKSLIDMGLLPTRIFSECGFSDYSVFFRSYKKYFGTAPKNHF